jgi:SNF2 family DNA or RNA helicase
LKLNELKSIVFKSTTSAMKKEGEDAFNKGLVTYFKGKKINDIYHLYGRVKHNNKEFNTHIKINIKKKKLEGAICSCEEFKECASSGYTLMCIHINATAYKFFSLLSEDKNETRQGTEKKAIAKENKSEDTGTVKLLRKTENDSIYYEGWKVSRNERFILKPCELRKFLGGLGNKTIKFKFDYIESTVPILNRDLPITFNLKEDNECIVLTTHKQLPIPLNPNNDVYYFKNELYLPSKKQIVNYIPLHEKLKANGKIIYRKDINNYNKLVSMLSNISGNINIAESLRNFASNLLKIEFFIFEEKNKIYCDVLLCYGNMPINILSENKDTLIRDYKKEEKLLMEIEKKGFIKMKDRFMLIGGDEELFNILSGRGNTIQSLGNVILGKGLKEREIYNSTSIKGSIYEIDGYYDFTCSIGNVGREELNNVFESYRDKNKFYKTKSNSFIDFEDDSIRSFFNVFEVLNISENLENGKVKLDKSTAISLYENIKNKELGFIKVSEELKEIEDKLVNINNRDITLPESFKGTLREYQINGVKWLKTLSEVGFGGILADEMGLGKTIQIIAFLLTEQNKRTFIICPTSLIHNWAEELQKFAPSIKVLIVHGQKRVETIDRISEYDVILTTYGTLRIDIDYYKDIIFDYCIIDEGQNIKNASALNTKVIKEIKSKTKFALTGTPIENKLIELWSIFDFVMPRYLYSKEKFEEKFILIRK